MNDAQLMAVVASVRAAAPDLTEVQWSHRPDLASRGITHVPVRPYATMQILLSEEVAHHEAMGEAGTAEEGSKVHVSHHAYTVQVDVYADRDHEAMRLAKLIKRSWRLTSTKYTHLWPGGVMVMGRHPGSEIRNRPLLGANAAWEGRASHDVRLGGVERYTDDVGVIETITITPTLDDAEGAPITITDET